MPAIPTNAMDANDAPPKTTSKVQQTEDQADVKMVINLWEQGLAARKEFDEDWKEREDFYNRKQWRSASNMTKSRPMNDIIFPTIQSQIALLTDSRPGFNVTPTDDPGDLEFSQLLAEVVDAWWDKTGMQEKLIHPLVDAKVFDAGFLKVMWDSEAMEGIGDIEAKVVSPWDIVAPYDARDVNDNCPWLVERITSTVGELKRKYPKMAEFIKPDDSKKDEDKDQQADGIVTLVSPTDRKTSTDNAMPSSNYDDRKTVTVYEAWMDDFSLEEYEIEHEDGTKEKKVKKKYPLGKVIGIMPFSKTRLFVTPNPNAQGWKPYVRFGDYVRPRRFWQRGQAGDLVSIQKNINKALQNITDYSRLVANPWVVTEDNNGVDPSRLTNKFACVIRTKEGKMGTIRREMPPAMPQYFTDYYQLLLRSAESVSGMSDLTQGRRGAGDPTAATAIEALQEAAHTRVRLQERNLQVSLSQLGRMIVSLMMQFYREPRVAKITGKNGWPQFFEFFVEQDEDGNFVSNRRNFETSEDENGQLSARPEASFEQGKPSKGLFDVRVRGGTSLPFARNKRASIALRMYESPGGPIIDREEVLDATDWPNKDTVQARMEEKDQALQAQAEQQQI